jgi:hypothetical protein
MILGDRLNPNVWGSSSWRNIQIVLVRYSTSVLLRVLDSQLVDRWVMLGPTDTELWNCCPACHSDQLTHPGTWWLPHMTESRPCGVLRGLGAGVATPSGSKCLRAWVGGERWRFPWSSAIFASLFLVVWTSGPQTLLRRSKGSQEASDWLFGSGRLQDSIL